MKILYLHIGLSKTGTSAIQAWLSKNSNKIIMQGFMYADATPKAAFGAVTSGNGVEFYHACESEDEERLVSILRDFYFLNFKYSIISSEVLQGLKKEKLIFLKKSCLKQGVEIRVIAFVRSIYEHLYSNYLQGIKRHGYAKPFGSYGHLDFREQKQYLENYFSVFGDALHLLNYDYSKADIIAPFLAVVKLNHKGLSPLDFRVNRSLSENETYLLRSLNQIHKGKFSQIFSDFLLASNPNLLTKPIRDAALVNEVYQQATDNLKWINSIIADGQPDIEFTLPNNRRGIYRDAPLNSLLNTVVDFALTQEEFEDEEKVRWINFLRDWAISLESVDIKLSFRLMSHAAVLRPNGPLIKKKVLKYAELIRD